MFVVQSAQDEAMSGWIAENTPPWLRTTILVSLFGLAAYTAYFVWTTPGPEED
jgi:hypothetical protein